MYRQLVCSLLIPMLLANQALAIGSMHVHPYETSDCHSSRPHIHLGFHNHHHHDGHGHEHHGHGHCGHEHCGHEHKHQGHEHHGETQNHGDGLDCDGGYPEFDSQFPCDHDCDAIYLPSPDDLSNHLSRLVKLELSKGVICRIAVWPPLARLTFSPTTSLPSPFPYAHCALFLQILCLRI